MAVWQCERKREWPCWATERATKQAIRFPLSLSGCFFFLRFVQHRNPFLWNEMHLSSIPNSNLQKLSIGMHSFENSLWFLQSKQGPRVHDLLITVHRFSNNPKLGVCCIAVSTTMLATSVRWIMIPWISSGARASQKVFDMPLSCIHASSIALRFFCPFA